MRDKGLAVKYRETKYGALVWQEGRTEGARWRGGKAYVRGIEEGKGRKELGRWNVNFVKDTGLGRVEMRPIDEAYQNVKEGWGGCDKESG